MKRKEYSDEQIEELTLNEHIRYRPIMYVGVLNNGGFRTVLQEILSFILSELNPAELSFEMIQSTSGIIKIEGLDEQLSEAWDDFNPNKYRQFLSLHVLKALSKNFSLKLLEKDSKNSYFQRFDKGELIEGEPFNQNLSFSSLLIEFNLDRNIWGEDYSWNEDFIKDEIRELAYLHRGKEIEVKYSVEGKPTNSIFCYDRGLFDKVENEQLSLTLGNYYFGSHLVRKIENFKVEIAFSFGVFCPESNYVMSYCNDQRIPENGCHVDGLIIGLSRGITKYIDNYESTDSFEVSKMRVSNYVLGYVHIKIEEPNFRDAWKGQLTNLEVVEPIADLVETELFSRMEVEKDSSEKLLKHFRI